MARVLWALLISSAVTLAVRAIAGPFRFGLSVNSPMNAEGIFGVALFALLLLGAREPHHVDDVSGPRAWQAAAILTAAGFAAYARSLRFPFLADDYDHIPHALHATPAYILALFTKPAADRFFRPAAFLAYAAEAHLAAFSPMRWHSLSLALHIAVSMLVYAFARRRHFRRWPALAAALLFLLHGSRPEAVTWIAAQFDLWAAFFFLLALLAFEKRWCAASLAPLLLALLSKESAYVYPLVVLLLLRIDRVPVNRWLRLAGPPFLLTGAVFVRRWYLLGGIGGYRNIGTGRPYILTFDILRTTRALTARLAAALDFPVNWSHPLQWWLIAALLAAAAYGVALAGVKADRRKLGLGFGILMLAALPVHEFLLIDANLEKARVLYLPSVGFVLIFAAVLEAARPRLAIGAACAMLAFQTASLEHNLGVWSYVSQLAKLTCERVAATAGPASLSDIPNTVDGVYFLHTGLRGCIESAAGTARPDLYLAGDPPPSQPATVALAWDDRTHQYVLRIIRVYRRSSAAESASPEPSAKPPQP